MELNSQSRIIESAELLSPETIPEKIIGRTEQIEKLRQCLKLMERGLPPTSAWLYGPAGTGKTLIARKITQEARSSQARTSLYVNCWERPTLHSVVQALCEQLKALGADAQDTNVKLARLRHALKDKTILIILDEIDHPMPKERQSIVYRLLQLPKTGLFCISTDSKVFINLDNRVKSKLAPANVPFQRYSSDEIKTILAERARLALRPNACSDNLLRKMASLANGDSRNALHILLKAAIAAEQDFAEEITEKHIPADTTAWQQLKQAERIESLNRHQSLIYALAKQHGQMSSIKLRRLYLLSCHSKSLEPVARRTFSKYLNVLYQGNLINIELQSVGGPGRLVKVVV